MKNDNKKESPFEKLKRKDGTPFDISIVKHWYLARAYVLYKLEDVLITPSSKNTLKVIIKVDDNKELMLAVVRHVALMAHYPNYVEYDELGKPSPNTHSVVIINTQDNDIIENLNREEYLNNLLKYCQYKINSVEQNANDDIIPIDIDFNIVDTITDKDKDNAILMTYSDVTMFQQSKNNEDIREIDTRMAILSSRVYDLGVDINNLPYEDIHDARRYNLALTTFEHNLLSKEIGKMIEKNWENDQVKVKNGLSNIYCSDRFRSIYAGINEFHKKERIELCKKCKKYNQGGCKKDALKCKKNKVDIKSCWENNDYKLAVSEHTRWIVEKLIFGFRPLNSNERVRYNSLLGNERKAYTKLLKGDPVELYNKYPEDYEDKHIDPTHTNLCTFKNLRRIDPDNRKYDSFLMLSIPMIINEVSKDDTE